MDIGSTCPGGNIDPDGTEITLRKVLPRFHAT